MDMKYILTLLINIFLPNLRAQRVDFEMVILHNNDMHSRFEQTTESIDGKYVGGFARTAYVIKEAREKAASGDGPPVLYLNAGDTYTGTIWFSVHRWRIVSKFLNALQPDAMCLGNHEFDDGIPGLNPFLNIADFPITSANLDFGNETTLAEVVKPYVILELSGKKIGIIGYLTPETRLMATVGSVTFEDEVTAVKRECENVKKEGANIIIALGHSGYKTDMRIAKEVEDIDLVIGGHTNTFLWNGEPPDREKPADGYPTEVKQRSGKIVPVVQAYAYTKYMGEIRLTFDDKGDLKEFKGQPIYLDETIPQDGDMLSLLEEFRPAVNRYNFKVVGKTRSYLNGETCRRDECNFGNALVDSFVDYVTSTYVGPYWTSTPIGIVNGGSVRLSVNASRSGQNVTAGDILGAVPFNQQLISFDLLGKDLISTLELGARSNGETSRGEFLQVSGLKVVYDFAKPSGNRVVSVKVRCGRCYVPKYSPILPHDIYRVVSTTFLINGGDGHVVLRDNSKNVFTEDIYDAQALERYFDFYKVLTPEEEERIIVQNLVVTSKGFKLNFNYVNILISMFVVNFIL